jgi:hypothetical protein
VAQLNVVTRLRLDVRGVHWRNWTMTRDSVKNTISSGVAGLEGCSMAVRRVRLIALALTFVVFGIACGSTTTTQAPETASLGATAVPGQTATAPAATSTTSLPAGFEHVFEVPANPIAVKPSLDEARAVEQDIPIEGGALTATAQDGTTFVLRIPADALASTAHIRMTPVAAIQGMPFGTDPHAVQLEPEGLHFLNFVTLTIATKSPIPPDQQIFFGYAGSGENLVLALPVVDSADLSIRLLHFSGAGVTSGSAVAVAQVQSRLGADVEARIASSIAAEYARLRSAELLGQSSDPIDSAAALELLQQIYEQVVAPLIAAAESSCDAGQTAVDTLIGFERQRALFGATGGDAGTAALPGLVNAVADRCVREEYQRCHDDHVIQHMVPTWQKAVRQINQVGVADPAVLETLAAFVEKCLVFDLEFQSMVAAGGGDGMDSYVKSTLQLRFDARKLRYGAAQATLENWKFLVPPSGECPIVPHTGDGTFRVMGFKYVTDMSSPTGEVGFVSDVELSYNPGPTHERFTIHCPDRDYEIGGPEGLGLWSGAFIALHVDESGMDEPGINFVFVAKGWEILGGHHYATKAWNLSNATATEVGIFDLYHSPE